MALETSHQRYLSVWSATPGSDPARSPARIKVIHPREEQPNLNSAILALEDGTVFEGRSFGAPAERSGEVVFNTALTGYQEVFTDPSYSGQIVILTNPADRQLRNQRGR